MLFSVTLISYGPLSSFRDLRVGRFFLRLRELFIFATLTSPFHSDCLSVRPGKKYAAPLTPSLPRWYLKTTNKSAKCQILKPLFRFFSAIERIFIKMHTIESRLLQAWKTYCLQVHPFIFQPGNFTGWGSERVKPSGWNCKNIFFQDLFCI